MQKRVHNIDHWSKQMLQSMFHEVHAAAAAFLFEPSVVQSFAILSFKIRLFYGFCQLFIKHHLLRCLFVFSLLNPPLQP